MEETKRELDKWFKEGKRPSSCLQFEPFKGALRLDFFWKCGQMDDEMTRWQISSRTP